MNIPNSVKISMSENSKGEDEISYVVERFSDIEVLRFDSPGFSELPLNKKRLIYHLSEATQMGRDIIFDQNCRYNLAIRRTLEAIYMHYDGDRTHTHFLALMDYLKRVWFSNGIHHHYGEEKFFPECTADFFAEVMASVKDHLPLRQGQRVDDFMKEIVAVIFDPSLFVKRTVQSGEGDWIQESANNFYGAGISKDEVEGYNKKHINPNDETPISFGLNSRLEKGADGVILEKVWRVGGLYGAAIERIVEQLSRAVEYAENEKQKLIIEALIKYYQTGDLKDFDTYSILWVGDTTSSVDFINGFIETYADPLGMKGSWEGITNFINVQASQRTGIISANAQWFEDHSPIDMRFKKEQVKGVSAKVITVVMLGGESYPTTPIGINLPNADWIRREYGSKSVTIENITHVYHKAAQGSGFIDEFVYGEQEKFWIKEFGFVTDNLHTDLHECLGHGSGKQLPGVSSDLLQAYGSTLEEARADLFALYYLADEKMLELHLLSDSDAYKSEYYKYMMNGLMTQLVRIELGRAIEEAHMRNRALIAYWVMEKGAADKVVEMVNHKGKTYVVINDYKKLRELFAQLLAEVQRIKSEGDFDAGKKLVETYGVKINSDLHKEMLDRYAKLNLAKYKGFINPLMLPIRDEHGAIIDIKLNYDESFEQQMMRLSNHYSFLPTYND